MNKVESSKSDAGCCSDIAAEMTEQLSVLHLPHQSSTYFYLTMARDKGYRSDNSDEEGEALM